MKRQELDLLDDEKLIWACVEPIIRNVRGKDPETKLQAFLQLNNGQRALFQFQVLYGHAAQGILQFFQHIAYLTDVLDLWSALKSGMNYFEDAEMLDLIKKMELAYRAVIRRNPSEFIQLED